jgi:allantoicase
LCSGAPGTLLHAEIDTAHFKGNFPESVELHAIHDDADIPERDEQDWTVILPRAKTGPHRQHFFHLENIEDKIYTHVKLTIHPDGGVKRVRIIGRRSQDADVDSAAQIVESGVVIQESERDDDTPSNVPISRTSAPISVLTALPLTAEAFAPFGQVIQAYADHNAVPRGTKITPANFDTASKFHKLALLAQSYPAEGPQATTGISVYRCEPISQEGAINGAYPLKALERHPYTNQAFIPFGAGAKSNSENLLETADRYLVVVAKEGEDGYPDLKTLRAFTATAAQGIVYNTGVWRESLSLSSWNRIIMDGPLIFRSTYDCAGQAYGPCLCRDTDW